jgi:hypothetical protein
LHRPEKIKFLKLIFKCPTIRKFYDKSSFKNTYPNILKLKLTNGMISSNFGTRIAKSTKNKLY